MSKHTLKLPQKADFKPDTIVVPTDAQIQEYLNKQRAAKSGDSSFDWKYDAPVESKPFNPATIPANARTIPVQAPPKVWGNPRLVPSN